MIVEEQKVPEMRTEYKKVDQIELTSKKSNLKSKSARQRRRRLRKSMAEEKNIKLYIEG